MIHFDEISTSLPAGR